jgi:hypothetical protein
VHGEFSRPVNRREGNILKSSIQPLSAVQPEQVIEYLTGKGVGRGLTREEVLWKYFDEEFNVGRERGFAWVKDGRVRGFIGCIPATRGTPAGNRELVWTCDWSVEEPARNPGIGIRLLSKVHKSTEFTAGVGGSADTHATVPRMRTRSVNDIAVTMRRPLRFGPVLELLEKRLRFMPQLSDGSLGRLMLPVPKRPAGMPESTVFNGVAVTELAPLFDQPAGRIARVRYDARHLAWLGRFPGTEFRTFYLAAGDQSVGALLWSVPREPSRWRFAVRHSPGAERLLDPVITDLIGALCAKSAAMISTMVSSHDDAVLDCLKKRRFVEVGSRLPLYIPEIEGPAGCAEGFVDMSYLDVDLPFI